tara:strand:- start:951 stop:1178 length:228 start_codon:yes stop_codon:yes gene_type:complete
MTDWDYNFGIKDYSKTVNQREYKQWRLTGVFHEIRLDSGKVANRTMSSYVSGKTVSSFKQFILTIFTSIFTEERP